MHSSKRFLKPGSAEVRRLYIVNTTLLILAIGAVFYIAAPIVVPVVFAALLTALLSPLVGRLAGLGLPRSLLAAGLLCAIVGALFAIIYLLSEPAEQWLEQAPGSLAELKNTMQDSRGRLTSISEIAEQVDELAEVTGSENVQEVVVQSPGMLDTLIGGLPSFLFSLAIVVISSVFALGSEYGWRRRLMLFGDTFAERRRILRISGDIQSQLSRYLWTVTLINLCLGAATGVFLMLLGFPNPMLWALMVALFNFAPYVGGLASASVLLVVSATAYSSLGQVLLAPLGFLALTFLEGQFLTPAILGRQLSVSPIVVFISVIAWGWLWGIAGALMAVPIMMALKACADHLPQLGWVSAALDSAPPGNLTPAAGKTSVDAQASVGDAKEIAPVKIALTGNTDPGSA